IASVEKSVHVPGSERVRRRHGSPERWQDVAPELELAAEVTLVGLATDELGVALELTLRGDGKIRDRKRVVGGHRGDTPHARRRKTTRTSVRARGARFPAGAPALARRNTAATCPLSGLTGAYVPVAPSDAAQRESVTATLSTTARAPRVREIPAS